MDKGAHYFRCDFQVHSPRDINWIGDRAVTIEEREQYAKNFIAKCRELKLDAVAITDHHDFAFFPYIKSAALQEMNSDEIVLQEHERIVVFPGLELTLSTPGCQALLIFDADFPETQLVAVLHFLGITPSIDEQPATAPTSPISNSIVSGFDDLYDKLDKIVGMKGRYIVLPNVSEGGRHTLLRPGNSEHYRKMPCVGGYVDGNISQHGNGNANIVAGRAMEYGNKAIGVFQTSDNRALDFSSLGKHSSWVKWAKPTAEAVRQACLARESRLLQQVPLLPAVKISQLDVTNSKFLGSFSLNFNSQYNAIIGGRGTGKSTILEYLRWALCDQTSAFSAPEEQSEIERKRQVLIEKTLKSMGGEVRVVFTVNGIVHVLKRNSTNGEILLKIGDGEFQRVSEDDVRRVLPVQAYSQKQLSSVGIDTTELRRFIEQPLLGLLNQLADDSSQIVSQTKIVYNNLLRRQSLEKDTAQIQLEVQSLLAQVTNLRSTLSGVSEADQTTISKKARYDNERSIIAGKDAELSGVRQKVRDLSVSLDKLPTPSPVSEIENVAEIAAIVAASDEAISLAKVRALELSNAIAVANSQKLNALRAQWEERAQQFEIAYEEAKSRSSSNQQQIDEIRNLESRIQVLAETLRTRLSSLSDMGDPLSDYMALRHQSLDLQNTKLSKLNEQAQIFASQSAGLIKAEVGKSLDIAAIKTALATLMAGTRIREDKIQAICDTIGSSQDPLLSFEKLVEELRSLNEFQPDDETNSIWPQTPMLDSCNFNQQNKEKIVEIMTEETWLEFATLDTDYVPTFKYVTNRQLGDEIPFSDASAGQQATALLSVLLNQKGAPLIIDQPEDDIDNRATDDIVNSIWLAKQKRQLIFSSHNANLVVNGDAELVVCCDYKESGSQTRGTIKLEGAIDIPSIRNEITSVMEGGEKAFVLRQRKYGF